MRIGTTGRTRISGSPSNGEIDSGGEELQKTNVTNYRRLVITFGKVVEKEFTSPRDRIISKGDAQSCLPDEKSQRAAAERVRPSPLIVRKDYPAGSKKSLPQRVERQRFRRHSQSARRFIERGFQFGTVPAQLGIAGPRGQAVVRGARVRKIAA